jgi:PmbA protein
MNTELLHDVVAAALRAGADAAEAVTAERKSLSVSVREGRLEDVENEESRDLGLRVFVGRSQAVVSGSDLSAEARGRLVERAVAMARLAPEDIYAGLAPQDRLFRGKVPDLAQYDPEARTAADLEAAAHAVEQAALENPGVSKSDGGAAGWSSGGWSMVTSDGFEGSHQASIFSLSATMIAGEGAGMERGGEGRATRWLADLPTAAEIGTTAAERTVARLNPRRLDSRTAPVIFENRIATSLLGPLVGAIAGGAVARGVSFLKDKLGQPVFAPGIRITEDPHRLKGLGSVPFDDEGVATVERALIDDGVLTTWLLNVASARQLGLETTGHASRGLAGAPGVATHNLTFQPGPETPDALRRAVGDGLWVTSMFGPSLNANTGDWSVGVSGFWFEKGELAYPVNEITVAGNLLDIYQRIVPASDLEIRGSSNAPSLLVDGLAIAGA